MRTNEQPGVSGTGEEFFVSKEAIPSGLSDEPIYHRDLTILQRGFFIMIRALLCSLFLAGFATAADAAYGEGYVEPDLSEPLFTLPEAGVNDAKRERVAQDLVKVAYFVADRPVLSAKAVALANTLVPKHKGAMVANFRFRMGREPAEVQMLAMPQVVERLLQAAALFLDTDEDGTGRQAAACLLEIAVELPFDDEPLLNAYAVLKEAAGGPADWSAALPRTAELSASTAAP